MGYSLWAPFQNVYMGICSKFCVRAYSVLSACVTIPFEVLPFRDDKTKENQRFRAFLSYQDDPLVILPDMRLLNGQIVHWYARTGFFRIIFTTAVRDGWLIVYAVRTYISKRDYSPLCFLEGVILWPNLLPPILGFHWQANHRLDVLETPYPSSG